MNKVFTKGEVLKAVPEKLFKSKCDLYGYASVEVPDREGDIIRVKGINRPEDGAIKVAVGHSYKALPDGTMPVVGTVAEWQITTKNVKGKPVPALAFGLNYAKADGELTPFAAQYKSLYDSGTLDAFSGGFDPNPSKVVALKGGRYDIQECEIFELSVCMIPVNPYATVMKALTDACGEDFDKLAYLEQRVIELQKATDRACGLHESLLKAFTERFDSFESKYVSQSDDAGQTADRRTQQPEADAKTLELLKALAARI